MNIDDIKPILSTIDYSEVSIEDQGYSFDEAHSFDEAGVMFGGLYGNEDTKPMLKDISDIKPQ